MLRNGAHCHPVVTSNVDAVYDGWYMSVMRKTSSATVEFPEVTRDGNTAFIRAERPCMYDQPSKMDMRCQFHTRTFSRNILHGEFGHANSAQ